MSEDEGTADEQLRSIVNRILRCKEAEDEAKADTKEVYAEAKSNGFDKTALGALVSEIRKREKDSGKVDELNAILDLYREAYFGRSGTEDATHAHTREKRRRQRMSESMDDAQAMSAEAAALGLISPEAHEETRRLTDAITVKYGAGIAREFAE